jgi:hypothetical protein
MYVDTSSPGCGCLLIVACYFGNRNLTHPNICNILVTVEIPDDPAQKDVEATAVPVSPMNVVQTSDPTAFKRAPPQEAFHGRFKTDIFGCCGICCSPLWWNAWCCLCIPMGQLFTRMRFSALGQPSANRSTMQNTFAIVVSLWVAFRVVKGLNFLLNDETCTTTTTHHGGYSTTEEIECEPAFTESPAGLRVVFWLMELGLGIYWLVVLTRVRGNFRRHYEIRDGCCGDNCCTDCCCVYWCTCCTVVQMLRHTHDEHLYSYQCCNTDGLPPGAPEIV